MKKSIFIISFILVALFFSFSYVLATNDGNTIVNNVRNTIGGAENAVENTANDVTGAVRNGFNTVGEKTENAIDDVNNAGNNMMNNADNANYTTTRTATDTTTNNDTNTTDMANNVWTWIIVAIIAITIIALIWYYTTKSNH